MVIEKDVSKKPKILFLRADYLLSALLDYGLQVQRCSPVIMKDNCICNKLEGSNNILFQASGTIIFTTQHISYPFLLL